MEWDHSFSCNDECSKIGWDFFFQLYTSFAHLLFTMQYSFPSFPFSRNSGSDRTFSLSLPAYYQPTNHIHNDQCMQWYLMLNPVNRPTTTWLNPSENHVMQQLVSIAWTFHLTFFPSLPQFVALSFYLWVEKALIALSINNHWCKEQLCQLFCNSFFYSRRHTRVIL